MITLPRLLIAAPMSGSGKTTLMAGLCAAWRSQGRHVAPFKVGPDYIDPSYHTLAAGRPCINLDSWLVPPATITSLFARHSAGADLALIEGVMGLFDGYSGRADTGSSAHIARLTATPVVIVLDVRAQARTAAALVHGLRTFDPTITVVGVILNRVGSAKHHAMVADAIHTTTGVPVFGALHRDDELHLPERHLGLVPTSEPGRWQAWLAQAQARVIEQLDLDALWGAACTAPPLPSAAELLSPTPVPITAGPRPRIAVADDAAFSFHYHDNLALLREAGAELVPFSPMDAPSLPPAIGALYLSGGFPEIYAEQLAANHTLCAAIRTAAAQGLPIYAECGGLMYLTETLIDGEGQAYPMVGVLHGHSRMTPRLTLGYRTVQATTDTWLLAAGETLRGHEFHYSQWEHASDALTPAYTVLADEWCTTARPEGGIVGNVVASYVHLHFGACPELATRFVRAAQEYQCTT